MFSFFKKPENIVLPSEFQDFPAYTGIIKKGPILIDKTEYSRISYYVKGGIEEYKQVLNNYGYSQKSEVKFQNQFNDNYIIIEKEGFVQYKIAYHKKK